MANNKASTIMSGLPIKDRKPKVYYDNIHFFGNVDPRLNVDHDHMHLVQIRPNFKART